MNDALSGDTRHHSDDRYNVMAFELRWVAVAAFVLASLLGTIVVTSYTHMLHPPSSAERVDAARLHLGGEFVERNLGTQVLADGRIVVRLVATRFGFVPDCVPVPAGRSFTLRAASPDVIHGLLVEGTNINTMVIPGEVAQVTSLLHAPGLHEMPCHEYCGLGHSQMIGYVRAVDAARWPAPAPEARLRCSATP